MKLVPWVLILCCCLCPAALWAAEKSEPIHVIADRLEVDNTRQVAHFIGAVKAVQGDVTIVCDKLDVYYERSQETQEGQEQPQDSLMDDGGKVHTVIAMGHVKITQHDRIAVGRKATYWAGSRTVLLEGQATAWKGANQVTGEQITLYLDENESIVESKPGRRVTVTMYPEQNKGGK